MDSLTEARSGPDGDGNTLPDGARAMPDGGAGAGGRLRGRTVVVTGGNTGLGYFCCEQLTAQGAKVVLVCRDQARAGAAMAAIRFRNPQAQVQFQSLDLADLASVSRAAEQLSGLDRIDALIANAGVIRARHRHETADGFELILGTNHLGHFALLAGLLPALERAGTRIVQVGSISHRWAQLHFDDPGQRRYGNASAYARSKLAVMLFGFELAQRLQSAGSVMSSVVAHPGLSLSAFTPERPGQAARARASLPRRILMRPIAQGKDSGAGPLVRAAVGPGSRNGQYWGPDGWFQLTGSPSVVRARPHAYDRSAAAQLWEASERLTGMKLRI